MYAPPATAAAPFTTSRPASPWIAPVPPFELAVISSAVPPTLEPITPAVAAVTLFVSTAASASSIVPAVTLFVLTTVLLTAPVAPAPKSRASVPVYNIPLLAYWLTLTARFPVDSTPVPPFKRF